MFKVGQKVKVRSYEYFLNLAKGQIDEYNVPQVPYPNLNDDMTAYCGKIVTIKSIGPSRREGLTIYRMKEVSWSWVEWMFEKEDCNELVFKRLMDES